jgi:hypothetical protein
MVVAEKLGYTLSELLERVTLEELALWEAFYAIRREGEQKAMDQARRRR